MEQTGEKKYTVELTEEECELIKNAIDAYEYVTNDVMSYDEFTHRRKTIVVPLYEKLPEHIF